MFSIAERAAGSNTAEIVSSLSDIEYKETDGGRTLLVGDNRTGSISSRESLAEYFKKRIKCPICKEPLALTKGKSYKSFLWCSECKKTQLLTPDEVNNYMDLNSAGCPEHGCEIYAKVGKYGLYLRCREGHNPRIDQI